jgi:hypothetical protein
MNINRILGVIMLRAPVYREIADDQAATTEAAIVFVVATLIRGFFDGLVSTSGGTAHLSVGGAIVGAIGGLVIGLIGWVFTSWVLAFVAKQLDGKTSTSEMLRVTGYVSVFGVVSVLNIFRLIPLLGCLTGLISLGVSLLYLIGYMIGVREAAEFTTGKAIITAVVAVVVNFVIVVLIGGAVITAIAGLFLLAGAH